MEIPSLVNILPSAHSSPDMLYSQARGRLCIIAVIRIPTSAMRTIVEMVSSSIRKDVILLHMCQLIPHMGLASRKTILGLCQTEQSAESLDRNISISLNAVLLDLQKRTEDVVSAFDLFQMTVHISNFPLYRSFISMMIRNEPLDLISGGDEAMREGFLAEFMAGQIRRDADDRISYQVLDAQNFVPAAYSIYYPIAPRWTGFARNLVNDFCFKLTKMGTIFPHVQRRKNMSRDTCRLLYEDGYRNGSEWYDFRTLDLELHKYRTGREINGDCEMRTVWRFNELKPRFYYATGGRMYWKTRYMKRIAVVLMECIQSTQEKRRSHPEDIQYSIEDEDYVMLWDYSAFTTSLSELKLFLYYIAKNMEDNVYCQNWPLEVC